MIIITSVLEVLWTKCIPYFSHCWYLSAQSRFPILFIVAICQLSNKITPPSNSSHTKTNSEINSYHTVWSKKYGISLAGGGLAQWFWAMAGTNLQNNHPLTGIMLLLLWISTVDALYNNYCHIVVLLIWTGKALQSGSHKILIDLWLMYSIWEKR